MTTSRMRWACRMLPAGMPSEPSQAGSTTSRSIRSGRWRSNLRQQLPIGALGALLARRRIFVALSAAALGMRELLTVGKVWELAQHRRSTRGSRPYDLVAAELDDEHPILVPQLDRGWLHASECRMAHRRPVPAGFGLALSRGSGCLLQRALG